MYYIYLKYCTVIVTASGHTSVVLQVLEYVFLHIVILKTHEDCELALDSCCGHHFLFSSSAGLCVLIESLLMSARHVWRLVNVHLPVSYFRPRVCLV